MELFSKDILRDIFSSLCELIFNPYAHARANMKVTQEVWDFERDTGLFLALLDHSIGIESSPSFLLDLEKISLSREGYWSSFCRYSADRLFTKLFLQNKLIITFIQKEVLSRRHGQSFKANLENILKISTGD